MKFTLAILAIATAVIAAPLEERVACDGLCTMQYDPVTCTNGKTYGNACAADVCDSRSRLKTLFLSITCTALTCNYRKPKYDLPYVKGATNIYISIYGSTLFTNTDTGCKFFFPLPAKMA